MTTASSSPLSPEHMAALEKANRAAQPLRRAAGVARSDAALTIVFGVAAVLSVFLDWIALPLGIFLLLLGINAARGARLLKRFDPRGLKILAVNQLVFAAVIISYAGYSLWYNFAHPEQINQLTGMVEAADIGIDIAQLHRTITWALYGGLIAGTIILQGIGALYYFSRRRVLEEYIKSTPEWIISFQRA